MIDVLIVLGLFIIVGNIAFGVWLVLDFFRLTARYRAVAKRRAVAKDNPYKNIDINFMVDAGMTPEEIEKAVRNALDRLNGKS